ITATAVVSTLSLHDALPIWDRDLFLAELDHVSFPELDNVVHFLGVYRHHLAGPDQSAVAAHCINERRVQQSADFLRVVREVDDRSEEHTSELQSRENLVCRL